MADLTLSKQEVFPPERGRGTGRAPLGPSCWWRPQSLLGASGGGTPGQRPRND